MKKPDLTLEIIREAVASLEYQLGIDDEEVNIVAEAYEEGYTEGYELAKYLDDNHWMDVDAAMVAALDELCHEVDRYHHNHIKAWMEENNITPKFQPGDRAILQGHEVLIAEIYSYRPYTYSIQFFNGDDRPILATMPPVGGWRSRLVWFDEVEEK